MRRAARVDGNQAEIVAGLRKFGATVQSLAPIGNGCPDILVGWRNRCFVIEIKDPEQNHKMDSFKALTEDQHKWHFLWQGQVDVVWTLEEAINIIDWND